MKMSLIVRETPSQIESIWSQYHQDKQRTISSTLPKASFKKLLARGSQAPFFIFPVKKDTGYFILFSQQQDNSFIVTTLEEYQKDPTNATPNFVLTMFDELVDTKGLALVRGDIIGNFTDEESDTLRKQIFEHYLEDPKFALVDQFNNQPSKFDFQKYIDDYLKTC